MKIQYMSDLHLEFLRSTRKLLIDQMPVVGDVLVVAGDFTNESKLKYLRRLQKRFDGRPIIYVPGNHEYYGRTQDYVDGQMWEIQEELENVHVLNPGIVEIDGVVFAGATLWFQDTMQTRVMSKIFSDFASIRDSMTGWMWKAHEQHVKFLRGAVADVIVTHHAPSLKSVHPRFERSEINPFFCNPLEELVNQVGARLWVHGHVHDAVDYMLSDTRIVCNPRGYKKEEGKNGFDPRAVIELDEGDDHDHRSTPPQ